MKTHNFLAVGLAHKPVGHTLAPKGHMDLAHAQMEKVRTGLLPWKAPLDAAEKEMSWAAGAWEPFSTLLAAVGGHGIVVLPFSRPA